MRRFQAIVAKEWKDARKNPQILLMAGMPLMFAFIFSKIGENQMDTSIFSILLALSMTGAFVQANMVCEEKEKHTLRVLMLSPASPAEVLLGKSLLTALLTSVVIVVCVLLGGVPSVHVGYISLLSLLSLVVFIAFGTVIGLLSRTVSESSIVGLPVLLIFVMGPVFGPIIGAGPVTAVVGILPTQHFILAVGDLAKGGGWTEIRLQLLNIAVWAVVSIVLCLFVYRKKRFDE
jgi:ABC-2 type transport system permease protein